MSSSMASSLLRRTLRLPLSSSNLCRHPRPLFYSSHTSSSSSPIARRAVPKSLAEPHSLLSLRFASSKVGRADENLKRVLESEIDCAKQEGTHNQEVPLPDGFPFEIVDNPGDQTITLNGEFASERIKVTVFMDLEGEANAEDDEDGSGDDDKGDSSVEPTITLIVNVDKGDGPYLEFCCNLNSKELSVETMAIKNPEASDNEGAYEGPEYSDLDESLQNALHKYLEVRGINSSLFDFLQEYMISKDDREYVTWLDNMKKFIEN